MKPSVGRIVHYVRPGSADGFFKPEHSAAIITSVTPDGVGLFVMNPNGVYFNNDGTPYDPNGGPRTWHWPEREDE